MVVQPNEFLNEFTSIAILLWTYRRAAWFQVLSSGDAEYVLRSETQPTSQ